MFEELINTYLPIPIHILEFMGIIIICIGAVRAFYQYMKTLILKNKYPVKHQFASSMAMALEFKLSAEILKTVLVRSLSELVILGAIFLLRVLMSLVINWEIKQDSVERQKNIQPNTEYASKFK